MKFALPLAAALVISALGIAGCAAPSDATTTTTLSATIPSSFHGTWTHISSGVHPPGGEEPWVLSAKSIQAHESYGEVRSVTIHGNDAITVIQDVSAEGTEFSDEKYFRLSPDSNRLYMKGTEGGPLTLYRVR